MILEGDRCIGVRTKEDEYFSNTVLVAIGAFTPEFLTSLPGVVDLFPKIASVAIVPWISVQLDEKLYDELKNVSIMVWPGKGEYLPPTKRGSFG